MPEKRDGTKPPPKVVAVCPVCHSNFVWVPTDGGNCLWCHVRLQPVEGLVIHADP
jgi:hypothetical protein